MSEFRIITTPEELEALDPDTLVAIPRYYGDCDRPRLAGWVRTFYPLGESSPVFPAVVVATGAQVRAARKALEAEAKPARPAAHEVQGILGSDWLNGEDPADLVRKHREGWA